MYPSFLWFRLRMRAKLVLLSTAVNRGISKGYFEVSAKGKKVAQKTIVYNKTPYTCTCKQLNYVLL